MTGHSNPGVPGSRLIERHCVVSLEKGTLLNLCLAMVQLRVYSDITERSITGK